MTRFSGITADDLDPSTARHPLVHQRTAYLKLRYFIDKGCIFVGHGLQNDFDTANIFVPPSQVNVLSSYVTSFIKSFVFRNCFPQVRDTVELWRLPNQRKISLRFLAAYLLGADIQDEIHDSVEDAKTALLLFRHYTRTAAMGKEHLQATLRELYNYGTRTNWTLGLERI